MARNYEYTEVLCMLALSLREGMIWNKVRYADDYRIVHMHEYYVYGL